MMGKINHPFERAIEYHTFMGAAEYLFHAYFEQAFLAIEQVKRQCNFFKQQIGDRAGEAQTLHQLASVDLNEGKHVERELMLVKTRAVGKDREELKRTADIFRARVIDLTEKTYVIELTGTGDKLDAFLESIDRSLILETVRSGICGVARGERLKLVCRRRAAAPRPARPVWRALADRPSAAARPAASADGAVDTTHPAAAVLLCHCADAAHLPPAVCRG